MAQVGSWADARARLRRSEQRIDIPVRQPQRPPARALEQRVRQGLLARLHPLDRGLDGILRNQPVHEHRLVLADPVRPVHGLAFRRRVRPISTEPEASASREHSEEAYRQLRIDWQRHAARAERSGMSPFDLDGAAELIRRIGEFAGNENLPAQPRRRLHGLVQRYTRHLEAAARLEAWLDDADRHWQRYDSIYRRAYVLDVAPDTLRPFRDWLERNERLLQAGRAIIDDPGGLWRPSRSHGRRQAAPARRRVADGGVLGPTPDAVAEPRQGTDAKPVAVREALSMANPD